MQKSWRGKTGYTIVRWPGAHSGKYLIAQASTLGSWLSSDSLGPPLASSGMRKVSGRGAGGLGSGGLAGHEGDCLGIGFGIPLRLAGRRGATQ